MKLDREFYIFKDHYGELHVVKDEEAAQRLLAYLIEGGWFAEEEETQVKTAFYNGNALAFLLEEGNYNGILSEVMEYRSHSTA